MQWQACWLAGWMNASNSANERIALDAERKTENKLIKETWNLRVASKMVAVVEFLLESSTYNNNLRTNRSPWQSDESLNRSHGG